MKILKILIKTSYLVSFFSLASAQNLKIENVKFLLQVDPKSLTTTLYDKDKQTTAHLAQSVIDEKEFQLLKNRIHYPHKNLSISFVLNHSHLKISIESQKQQSFVYPKIHIPKTHQLIVPHHEGRYIPLHHQSWLEYLQKDDWNTTESLTMPFWGIKSDQLLTTYIFENPFHNTISFKEHEKTVVMSMAHQFSHDDQRQEFTIYLDKPSNVIQPALHFRKTLQEKNQIVSLEDKMKVAPQIRQLIGAPHAYIWGGQAISHFDIKKRKWQDLAKVLQTLSIKKKFSSNDIKMINEVAKSEFLSKYQKREFTKLLSEIYLDNPDVVKKHLSKFLIEEKKWGNGISTKLIDQLEQNGFSRFLLVTEGWQDIERRPHVADYARKKGYLLGTYDSFHSIHNPKTLGSDQSWLTAQFDESLYKKGAILKADGTPRRGFKGIGYKLSPKTARPYVEDRVKENFSKVNYSYYFVDADAFGEYYDDFRPNNRLSQQDDVKERVDRLNWIFQTFQVPIGSEGGFYQFAPVQVVAEGIFIPVIAWSDQDMKKNKKSPFYLGRYWTPDMPEVFFKSVPMKKKYIEQYIDPRYRLPLYEVVFHDSVLATAHWGYSSLKFHNVEKMVYLTEMLYQVAPLYHLNLDNAHQLLKKIKPRFESFLETHSYSYQFPLQSFEFLTSDRLVQKATYGELTIVVNFSKQNFQYQNKRLPAMSGFAINDAVKPKIQIQF